MKKYTLKLLLISAAAALVLGGGVLAACGENADHTVHTFGEWETVTAVSCTEPGVKRHTCTYPGCGYSETEDIPALDHDWGPYKVTVAATCQHGGKRTKTCRREGCGEIYEDETARIEHDWVPVKISTEATCLEGGEEDQSCSMCHETRTVETKPLGHNWGAVEIETAASCTAPGTQKKICTRCGETEEEEIPQLAHMWMNTGVSKAATCEAPGEQEQTCQRMGCGAKQTVEIPALGHSWQGYYTVDRPATFEEEGSKSYHCNRCDQHNGETVIPRLDANTPIEYEFRTLRNNGELINDPSVVLIVKDKEGKEVARSTGALNNGVFVKDLLPKEYTVSVENLPKGYSAAEEYSVTPFEPYCNVYFTASPISGTQTGLYRKGSVMYDFTVPEECTTVPVGSLKEILETKKAVLLNFWYEGCVHCENEFPGLERAYTMYRDSVEVLGVNCPQAGQSGTLSEIRTYGKNQGLTFPLVQNSAVKLAAPFSVYSWPVSVLIDAEGVVCEILVGETSQEAFIALFEKYTSDDYLSASRQQSGTAVTATQYALPAKREDD